MPNEMNAVLLSVRPTWCENICHQIGTKNGKPVYEKSLEVRKSRPKIPTPFKCYIYCTAPKKFYTVSEHMATSAEYLHLCDGEVTMSDGFEFFGREDCEVLNRRIIGEFVCDCITGIFNIATDSWKCLAGNVHEAEKKMVEHDALLSESDLHAYANGKNCYGWHISALKVYNKPRELSEFKQCHKCPYGPMERCREHEFSCDGAYNLSRAPQSWCYVKPLEPMDGDPHA